MLKMEPYTCARRQEQGQGGAAEPTHAQWRPRGRRNDKRRSTTSLSMLCRGNSSESRFLSLRCDEPCPIRPASLGQRLTLTTTGRQLADCVPAVQLMTPRGHQRRECGTGPRQNSWLIESVYSWSCKWCRINITDNERTTHYLVSA
jgi:hypothetical protein